MRSWRPWTIGLGFGLSSVAAMSSPVRGAVMVPAYNSFPTTRVQLYLDFNGDHTDALGPYTPGDTPAYSVDADTNNFTAQELDNIHTIWASVSEKYSPFNVNVTTVDPGNATDGETMRIVIGGDGAWAPPTPDGGRPGGIAAFYAFISPLYPNVGFVFPQQLQQNAHYIGEAASHEAGHGFGLRHQSLFDEGGTYVSEYNPGDANVAPIMGVSYYSARGKWWRGQDEQSNSQDDLFTLARTGSSTNNFGYRTDDHGSTLAAADPLLIGADLSITGKGIIERTNDSDYFSFTTPGGLAQLAAGVSPFAPMLDLSMRLYDGNGTLLTTSATSSLGEGISMVLPPGSFRIAILSAGQYGDIGQYFISGFIPEPSTILYGFGLLGGLAIRRNPRRPL
jgi:hypothetical protein